MLDQHVDGIPNNNFLPWIIKSNQLQIGHKLPLDSGIALVDTPEPPILKMNSDSTPHLMESRWT